MRELNAGSMVQFRGFCGMRSSNSDVVMTDSGMRHGEGCREGPSYPAEADAELSQVIACCLHAVQSGPNTPYRREELGRRIRLLLATEDHQKSA
jgi:hypothetical protein